MDHFIHKIEHIFDIYFIENVSGYSMKIYAIDNGRVSMHLKSPNFNNNLPIIPSEMTCVNFTWRSGTKKYYYHFDRLQSLDETILKPPTVSIRIKGKVPQESKGQYSFELKTEI